MATLDNKQLFLEDVLDQLPKAGTMERADSTAFVDRLITEWAKNELLVAEAEFNLNEELVSLEELVRRYRNDLLKHAYVERYVSENLDTNISDEAVQVYYEANLSNFELKESIVQGRFLAAPVGAKDVEKAKRWFLRDANSDDFLEWAEIFASKQSMYGDSSWIPLDEFLSDIPLEVNNVNSYLSRNRRFTCEDTLMVYFVQVEELRVKDSYSPINYVRSRIENVLLNKRRLELISRIEENIIEDAIEEGKLIIH